MQKNKGLQVRTLVLIGVLAALVFALSLIEVRIPVGMGDKTRIHFGNIMCLVAGAVFGPVAGGLAAGFGSMIYDFTHPEYIMESWITFITKFAMAFVTGWLVKHPFARLPRVPRVLFGAVGGQLTYIVLYLAKTAIMQHYIYGNPWQGVWAVVAVKAAVASVNGLIAVVGCTLLAPALQAALQRAGLFTGSPPKPA